MPVQPNVIHQYSPSVALGDGVSNGILFTQRLLQKAGIHSEIYAHHIEPGMEQWAKPFSEYLSNKDQTLLIHHSIGNGYEDALEALSDKIFMVYHNITPGGFFAASDPIQPMLAHGREQLVTWQRWLKGAIGDSEYNTQELLEAGFAPEDTTSIPLLVDLQQLKQRQANRVLLQELRQDIRPTLLFVGRMMPHKRQHLLIQMLGQLKDCLNVDPLPKLYLVGGGDPEYIAQLRTQIEASGLKDDVVLTGKVSEEDLTSYYRAAEAFVCASEHEGFGMPLIEAMFYDVPVIALDYGAIASTLDKSGLLLESCATSESLADIVAFLLQRPELRTQLLLSQQSNLQRFHWQTLYGQLVEFLGRWSIPLPSLTQIGSEGIDTQEEGYKEACDTVSSNLRIEGPFDSSYSLALLNRELARALDAKLKQSAGQTARNVELHSTEGGGDFAPDESYLQKHPDLQRFWQRSQQSDQPIGGTMRLLYPPRVNNMPGLLRLMGNYGWEESVFPAEYRRHFNHKLNLVTTMSDYVNRVMVDSGVSTPIKTIGVGVDHIERVEAGTLSGDLQEQLAGKKVFLHISSCFPRKGVDCLLRAWDHAFTQLEAEPETNIVLLIKTFPNPHNDIGAQLQGLQQKRQAQGRRLAPVLLIEEDWSDSQVKALYLASHVLVAPSRGEGFGLPMAEAMWLGVPVITTGYGGQTDFCRSDNSWLINYTLTRAQTHMQQSGSVWADPDVDHLAELLKGFYPLGAASLSQEAEPFSQAEIQARVARAQQYIRGNYCWSQVAGRLLGGIDTQLELLSLPQGGSVDNPFDSSDRASSVAREPQKPRLGWITTWNSKCGIAAYSAFILRPLAKPASGLMPSIPESWILANTGAEVIDPVDEGLKGGASVDSADRVIRCWQSGGDLGESQLDQVYRQVKERSLNQVVIQFNFSFFDLKALKKLLGRLKNDNVQVLICFHSTADVYWGEEKKTLLDLMPELADVARILVHSCHDLNRLKSWGLEHNSLLFPHGVQASLDVLPVPSSDSGALPRSELLPSSGKSLIADSQAISNILPASEITRLQGKTVVACYGFMLPHKGIDTLVEAFPLLLEKMQGRADSLHLLLVNALYPVAESEQMLSQCQQRVTEFGLNHQVTFVSDFLPEAECLSWLQQADVVVFPYQQTQESSSAAVRTGLASGSPVVCTPLDIFEDVQQAVNFLPGIEADAIAEGLKVQLESLEDPKIANEWQQRRGLWLKQHDWGELAERFAGLLQGLLRNN